MATACDKNCSECQKNKHSVYICLKSELEFLSSLLRLGTDEQGRRNLLGYNPSHLIDWFLYAKRSFRPRLEDSFERGLKLLDELGKLLFDIDQVTARSDSDHRLLLVSGAERKLVDAFLGSDGSVYEKLTEEAIARLDAASEELPQNRDKWRASYSEELEIRKGFTLLKNSGLFTWEEMNRKVWLLQWREGELDRRDKELLSLSQAYLHGVARFALGEGVGDWNVSGYWIDTVAPEEGVSPTAIQQEEFNIPKPDSDGEDSQKGLPQVYCGVPSPTNPALRFACEAAATFLEEFIEAGGDLFDLLFMCKGESGWFWAFSRQQYDYIAANFERSRPRKLRPVLESFRLETAGFINLLERTENLIIELRDFREETFICESVGYQLEETQSVAKDFADAESLIPGVGDSSFYYLRVSDHRLAAEEGSLSEGSLVAQFRVNNKIRTNPAERLKVMGSIRAWVERWRAKDHSRIPFSKVIRDIERPLQRRTARAAIMSRNLSHNIGSHALANSRFYDAVGVLHLETSAPDESKEKTQCLHADAPPGRETKHITKGEVWRARTRLGTLNSYLQGRLDFIARALGETASHPEPIFFINDLLKGFLSQTVLLNTLFSDNGFTGRNIEFRVWLPDATEGMRFLARAEPVQHLRHVSFELESNDTFRDVLVAIPGGMVGRHAFYAFMENLMRNAVKYGALAHQAAIHTEQQAKPRLTINLRLEERGVKRGLPTLGSEGGCHACYELTITENLSPDLGMTASGQSVGEETIGDAGKIALQIRTYLNEDIIDEAGQLQTRGHGIQEMKVCAQFLAGGDRRALVFPSDRIAVENDGEDDLYRNYLLKNRNVLAQPSLDEAGSRGAWMGDDAQNSLRCLDAPCLEDGVMATSNGGDPASIRPHLAYRLILQRPTLLGIVDSSKGADLQSEPATAVLKEPSVVFYNSIETLATNPAYFGLILVRYANFSPDLLREISSHHVALPYRLMIVVESEEAASGWRSGIESWQEEKAENWWRESEKEDCQPSLLLPPRRIYVIHCAELLQLAQYPDEGELSQWQHLICTIYEKWLCAFKGHELRTAYPADGIGPWHLCIGFDRDAATIREKWYPQRSDGEELRGFKSAIVHLHLFASGGEIEHDQENRLPPDILQGPTRYPLRHAILALDNHGNVFPGLEATPPLQSIAAYHTFSGTEQAALFQMLDSPPTEEFPRAMFIYSVVESLLTRIVVVDERVAKATVETVEDKPRICRIKTRQLQLARVYPVYSVQTEVASGESSKPLSYPLSEQIGEALKEIKSGAEEQIEKSEGLAVSPISQRPDQVTIRIAVLEESRSWRVRLVRHQDIPADCIVVHEGVIDILFAQHGWPTGTHHQLYAICPWVVRTSGRGSVPRHLGEDLPFLEFSELSDTTYRQMDKVTLAKGLLSLRGAGA